jgi:hypothetical protein
MRIAGRHHSINRPLDVASVGRISGAAPQRHPMVDIRQPVTIVLRQRTRRTSA